MADSKPWDPRLGDESNDSPPRPIRRPSRHVRLDEHPTLEEYDIVSDEKRPSRSTSDDSSQTQAAKQTKSRPQVGKWILDHAPFGLQWIPDNWSWSKIKPVIRCAIVAWISMLFFMIKRLEILLGQVSVFEVYYFEPEGGRT